MNKGIAENPTASAEAAIRMLLQEMHTMGGNDSEPSAIQQILEKLQAGTIDPISAQEQAQKIRDRKSDYH